MGWCVCVLLCCVCMDVMCIWGGGPREVQWILHLEEGEGGGRPKAALTEMAVSHPSTMGRGHPGCCDISISIDQVKVGMQWGLVPEPLPL